MNFRLTLASLFFPTLSLVISFDVIKLLPWSSDAEVITNISAYVIIAAAIWVYFAVRSTLRPFFENAGHSDAHSKRTMGAIQLIQYSGIRVNNSPRFKLTVEYQGIRKVFDGLSEQVQFNLKVGDQVVIYFNPTDRNDSYLDLDETLSLKLQSKSTFESNALFEVKSLVPVANTNNNEFTITGEVHPNSGDPYKAAVIHTIQRDQVTKITPGMLFECLVEGDKDQAITMNIEV